MKTFGWDDFLHIFACLILIVYGAVYNASFPGAFNAVAFVQGTRPDLTYHEWDRYFRFEVAVSLLFWIVIYAVKFSFLMFYRDLFQVSTAFMRFWWVVVAFTLVTFGACFISLFWGCGSPSKLFVVGMSRFLVTSSTYLRILLIVCISILLGSDTERNTHGCANLVHSKRPFGFRQ